MSTIYHTDMYDHVLLCAREIKIPICSYGVECVTFFMLNTALTYDDKLSVTKVSCRIINAYQNARYVRGA
jgi:hypothetical protein